MPVATVAIMIDALRGDYIHRGWMPWLNRRTELGVAGTLIPPLGFEPDAAYYAGIEPGEVGGGVAYVYADNGSPFGFTRYLPRWCDKLPRPGRAALRFLVKRLAMHKASGGRLALVYPRMRIPFALMQFFDFAEHHIPTDPNAFGSARTVFDYLRAAGVHFFSHAAPVDDVRATSVIRAVRQRLSPDDRFVFLHIGDLDWVGHEFGPDSDAVERAANRVDDAISELHAVILERLGACRVLVFGDHGMAPVRAKIDALQLIKSVPGVPVKDFVYFLDSTLARFWYWSDKLLDQAAVRLSRVPGTRLLTDAIKQEYGVPSLGRGFGDLVLWAEPGHLFSPNFFQENEPVLGMHGYPKEERGNWTAFVAWGPNVAPQGWNAEPAGLVRLFATLIEFLELSGVPIPGDRRPLLSLRRDAR